jgi:hypothetical protein
MICVKYLAGFSGDGQNSVTPPFREPVPVVPLGQKIMRRSLLYHFCEHWVWCFGKKSPFLITLL